MNEIDVLKTIQKYIESCLFGPMLTWPEKEFKYRSYSRWAANEIYQRIIDEVVDNGISTDIDKILCVIQYFIIEMDYYVELSGDNKECRFLFSVARDAAYEILYLFEE